MISVHNDATYLDKQYYIDQATELWEAYGRPSGFRIKPSRDATPPQFKATFRRNNLVFLEVTLDGKCWITLIG